MIRGALILGVGFVLGYTKALQEQDDIRAKIAEMASDIKEAFKSDDDTGDSEVIDLEVDDEDEGDGIRHDG